MDENINFKKDVKTKGRNTRGKSQIDLKKQKKESNYFINVSAVNQNTGDSHHSRSINFPNQISLNIHNIHKFSPDNVETPHLNNFNNLNHPFLNFSVDKGGIPRRQNSQISNSSHPHPLLRNSVNIKWFRDRSTSKMIEKSLNDYYEKNQQSKIIIKPKYLFSESTFKKISKLKYLFGQFDKDKSSKNNFN
jgi:hypothetical protein